MDPPGVHNGSPESVITWTILIYYYVSKVPKQPINRSLNGLSERIKAKHKVQVWMLGHWSKMLLTLEADTELCGDPSRDTLTDGPGALSLSTKKEEKKKRCTLEEMWLMSC